MQRRFCLTLLAASLPLGMVGCGFALRGTPKFAFKSLFSPFAESSLLGTELKRSLEAGGNMRVITEARQISQADVILEVLQEEREKTVVAVNASGQVREFQLRIRFQFKLSSAKGNELIPLTEIVQRRDISFNESAVLAKESEEGVLYREMQSDIIQQIMRRLASLRSVE